MGIIVRSEELVVVSSMRRWHGRFDDRLKGWLQSSGNYSIKAAILSSRWGELSHFIC